MKLFGEYLIEKNLITPDALLGALLDQMKSMPNLAEIVHQSSLLNNSQLLTAITEQCKSGLDFKSACIKSNLWNENLEKSIQKELEKFRTPIGQILVSKGAVTLSALSEMLDLYLAERLKDPSSAVAVSSPTQFPTPSSIPPTGNNEKPAESPSQAIEELPFKPEFQKIDPSVLLDYFELFSDDKRSETEKLILTIESELKNIKEITLPVTENLNSIYRIFHTLKGSARFIRADLTEKIIHQAEEVMTLCANSFSKFSPADFEQMVSMSLKVVDITWELKESLKNTSTEESVWNMQEWNLKYRMLFFKLRNFKQTIESKS